MIATFRIPVTIPAEVAALSDDALFAELELLNEELADGSSYVAEIEGEFARFGDGPPGSQAVLDAYRADEARARVLRAERDRRFPLAVVIPFVGNDEDVPF